VRGIPRRVNAAIARGAKVAEPDFYNGRRADKGTRPPWTTTHTISKYDRKRSDLKDVGLWTRPSTIQHIEKITGKAETFVVTTARHEDQGGDFILLECVDEASAVTRVILPPQGRQRDRGAARQPHRRAGAAPPASARPRPGRIAASARPSCARHEPRGRRPARRPYRLAIRPAAAA
jgi:hypothetical protein